MRKTVVLLASVALALVLAAGAALAADITCPTGANGLCEGTEEDDILRGTPDADTMRGFGGNDTFHAEGGPDHLEGGLGDDILVGLGGNDKLHGQDGDDILGILCSPLTADQDCGQKPEPGRDTFTGGPGEDEISARDKFKDTINCGEGSTDLAVFNKRLDSVHRNCERRDWTSKELPSCAPRPWDNASVKCIKGTNRADKLVGRDDPDPRMVDVIWGLGGNDTLRGRRGFDGLEGGTGNDILQGGPGNDALFGDRADQSVLGDEGIDELDGGDGDDFIDAIDGNDEEGIVGKQDTISCGPGNDRALIDQGIDVVAQDCEEIEHKHEDLFHWWRKCMRRR